MAEPGFEPRSFRGPNVYRNHSATEARGRLSAEVTSVVCRVSRPVYLNVFATGACPPRGHTSTTPEEQTGTNVATENCHAIAVTNDN